MKPPSKYSEYIFYFILFLIVTESTCIQELKLTFRARLPSAHLLFTTAENQTD